MPAASREGCCMSKNNVLITGNIDASVWNIAERLENDGCTVTVAATHIAPKNKKFAKRYFEMSLDTTHLSDVYRSGRFDTVVFFMSAKSETPHYEINGESRLGRYLDVFVQHIEAVQHHPEIAQLILITDQRVFGEKQIKDESVTPEPDSFESSLLLTAETELERFSRKEGSLVKLLLRVPHIYTPGPAAAFANDFRASGSSERQTLYLPGTPEKKCGFLSADDMGKLLLLAVTERSRGVMHVKAPEIITYAQLKSFFEGFGYNVVYMGRDNRRLCLEGTRARKELGFVASGSFRDSIFLHEKQTVMKRQFNKLRYLRRSMRKTLPWIETGAGALLMELAAFSVSQNTVTAFIDVRLLYAVIIGSTHGLFFGCIAGLVAYISYAAAYLLSGGQAWDLLLNLDNWLPFELYLLAGALTGYMKTTNDDKQKELLEEKRKVEKELHYMQDVHQHTCDMRDMLMEQVVKSRDSYGKIYSMVDELNSVYPDEILFHALHIYEDVLSNNTVSIFIRENGAPFLRKVVESEDYVNTENSLDLNSLPELKSYISDDKLYVNKEFRDGYPAFCLTIPYKEGRKFVIMLWEVQAQQYTKYYENLLTIVSRLTRMALTKAIEFNELPERYVDNTLFLKQDEFIHSWQMRKQMKNEKVGSYVLFRFSSSLPDDVLSERFGRVVRSLDIAGKMNDGKRYILMMQATEKDIDNILSRMENAGVAAYAIDEKELMQYA